MPGHSQFLIRLWFVLLLTVAMQAAAQEKSLDERPASDAGTAQRFDQMLYKGIVGNLLDAVPMDADERTALQRTNAVASGAMSGKSLAALAKLAHPGFLIGGIVWGLWAASNIESAPNSARRVAAAAPKATPAAPDAASAGKEESLPVLPPVLLSPMASIVSTASTAEEASPRPRVVRVWTATSSSN